MDKNEILKQAKMTIDNIDKAQATLDQYSNRLKGIVEKLEAETVKKEKLTLADVNNINDKLKGKTDQSVSFLNDNIEGETFNHTKKPPVEMVKFEPVKANEPVVLIKVKNHNFLISVMLFLAIIAIASSALLTIKALKPDVRFFNHYVYNYEKTNMEPDINNESLIIVKKLDNDNLKVNDLIVYKLDKQTIKSVKVSELIDGNQAKILAKSVNNMFDDEELLIRSEIIGKVKYAIPVVGGVLSTLLNNLWLIYLISGLCLLIAFMLNGKSEKNRF